ncbi:hypothetical protein GPECTOR_1g807 [Gonium pectorale]|uniref:DUF1963 domain-containing protein n=1 Tax=Gonium pectorale TaxID=33097 RepID=A0A150H4E3_GONPE|nr:hypothetical protein GPECTOR_1g807 [Gonium pectorale]|eukprot:KXZ56895.1 hypothetical protein GPECTOR_1g807 [Gonium pectorale]
MGKPFLTYEDDDEEDEHNLSAKAWMEAARKALEGHDIDSASLEAALKRICDLRRPAFKPNCEPAPEDGLGLLESKIGGLPYLTPHEAWPTADGCPLAHLWQQRVGELPLAVQEALGHCRGLLQVFVLETLDQDGDGSWYLVRVLGEEQLAPRPRSEVAQALPAELELLDEHRVCSYSRSYDFPVLDDLLSELTPQLDPDVVADVVNGLQEANLYRTLSGDKLLGWPNWCQGPEWCEDERRRRFTQIVQIEGSVVDFPVGDSGTLLLQRHPEQRNLWAASWACC